MVYRFSWLAGIAAIMLAYWELSFVLRNSTLGTPWQLAIAISAILGAGVTWTLLAYKARAVLVFLGNALAFIITAGLLLAPKTLWLIFPTFSTWSSFRFEMSKAIEVIRFGIEPVRPVPGLVVLLALLFWILGFLLVAGLLNDRPFVALMTPLIVALQFVIIDRRPKGLLHVAVFLIVVAMALLAIRIDERDKGSGRLHRVSASGPPTKRPSPAITVLVAATVVLAVTTVAIAGDSVPNSGFVTWRSPAGYSDGYSGSVSYNPYTDIRASLISQTSLPVFEAKVSGMAADQLRFRTVTLDVFRNERFQTDRVQVFPTDEEPWINDSERYRGETVDVATTVRIRNLSQPWLPAPVTSSFASARDEGDNNSIRVRRIDGSLFMPGYVTYDGMEYTVQADVARYDAATLASLIRTEDGSLSPLFKAAEDGGELVPESTVPLVPLQLERQSFYTQVPSDVGPGVAALAEQVTANLETNYEKAIALEQYFRFSGEFTYNASVAPEYTTSSTEEWLTDDENPFVRTGYCEQFAQSMALMARTVGLPSRVILGFTPGTPLNDTTVVVMDKNAHSWVEIWVPELGWMAFDPTPRANFAAPTANDDLAEVLGFSPAEYIDDIPTPEIDDGGDGLPGSDASRFERADDNERFRGAGGGGGDGEATGFAPPPWSREAVIVFVIILLAFVATPLAKSIRKRRLRRRLLGGDITAAWLDITERLADFGERIDPSDTPLETASNIDSEFVPLARTYGDSLYGEHKATTTVIERATSEHSRANEHLNSRYSNLERIKAAYRPTKAIEAYRYLYARFLDRNGR